jgi:hypothetical protein
VQSRVAVGPAVQSMVPASDAPGEQAGAITELPVEQTPDPLAISPKGTMTGDSYFGFPLAFWSDIGTPPFSKCIYLVSHLKTTSCIPFPLDNSNINICE